MNRLPFLTSCWVSRLAPVAGINSVYSWIDVKFGEAGISVYKSRHRLEFNISWTNFLNISEHLHWFGFNLI